MNPRPVEVKVLDNYNLLVTFQNDEKKIFDVKPLLSMPLYQPLRNKALFKKAKADGMCIYWNDEIDICPDTLYLESRPVSGQEPAEKDQNHMTAEETEAAYKKPLKTCTKKVPSASNSTAETETGHQAIG